MEPEEYAENAKRIFKGMWEECVNKYYTMTKAERKQNKEFVKRMENIFKKANKHKKKEK